MLNGVTTIENQVYMVGTLKKKHFLVYYPYCGWYDTLNDVTTIEKQVYMVDALTKKCCIVYYLDCGWYDYTK
jgi:hypothetical protein